MFDELPWREVHVGRILELREIAVNEVEEREEHGQCSNIGVAIVVSAIDEHAAEERPDEP